MKFQGDVLIFFYFIQVFVFPTNQHLKGMIELHDGKALNDAFDKCIEDIVIMTFRTPIGCGHERQIA